ncbi:MAG: DNA polymerase Y family protein [Verrucomicrobiales bacterium]|nr:DNA polymerase Y family protein [Verrucomicrobiales bacterium]
MFAAIHIPRPALQALFIEKPGMRYQPVVVLDEAEKTTTSKRDRGKLRVLEISAEAEEFGIHRGMTAVQAQARCDYLELLNRSPRAETDLTETLLDCAGDFTPDFEDTECGTCILDLGGVAAIDRDALRISRQIHERISDHQFFPRIGMATNPDLAALAARACRYVAGAEEILVIRDQDREQILSPLPVGLLDLTPEMSDLFDLWGLRNLGELARLSRADLVERLGAESAVLWDQACGTSRRLLRLVRPVAEYSGTIELEYEITTTEPLVFLLRRLLDTIAARLRSAWLVAARLSLRLDLAGGNRYQRVFRIPEPCADVDMLTGMLAVHLEDFEARSPVTGITLQAIPTRAGKHQFDLFAAGVKDPNRLSETLARVEALLGSERFGVPRLRPTHHPDSFEMRPFHPGKEPVCPEDETLLIMKQLPMRRYRPRRHVLVQCEGDSTGYSPAFNRVQSRTQQGTVGDSTGYSALKKTPPAPAQQTAPLVILSGDFKGRIVDTRGPYSASGSWWEKRIYWRREEWDVAHENGRIYRLVKEKGEWFVEAVG